MRLPNKLYRYNESVFVDMIKILSTIKHPIGVYDLYKKVKNQIGGIDRYVEALDGLSVLNKITFDKEAGIIDVVRN